MDILLVTPYYPPDLGPSAPLVGMLAEDLVEAGHRVTVIAAAPHFPSGRVLKGYRGLPFRHEERRGVRVVRTWIPSGERSRLLHRLVVFAIYQLLAGWAALRQPCDVILATNPALETGLPALLLNVLRRKPLVWAVWDLYPEAGVRLGVFRAPWQARLVGFFENLCLRRASAVQAIDESFAPALRSRTRPGTPVVVIPPWVDLARFAPRAVPNEFARRYGLQGCFVALYAGNMGLSQGLETVLEAAALVRANGAPAARQVRFVLVGDGARRAWLEARASKLGLDNVIFLPYQPAESLPEVLAAADLALVCQRAGLEEVSLPSKAIPLLAAGRAILAASGETSGLARLVRESGARVCVPAGDASALAQAVLALQNDAPARQAMGECGRRYAEAHFDRRLATGRFLNLIRQAVQPGSN